MRFRNKAGSRRCVGCLVVLPLSEYTGTGTGKGLYRCRPCNRIHTKKMLTLRKDKCYMKLGGWVCACCGCNEKTFLTIDHINGGGNKFRKECPGGDRIYSEVLKLSHPRETLQVLCMNCNWAKGKYGQCPHEAAKAVTAANREEQVILTPSR